MRKLLTLKGRSLTDDVTLTKKQAAALNASMVRWFSRSPRVWASFIGIMLAPLAIFILWWIIYYQFLDPYGSEPKPLAPADVFPRLVLPIAAQVIGSSVSVMIGGYFAIRFVWEQRYRKELRAIGYDLCERCDYRLDGHDELARCPECGMRMDRST